MLLYLPLLYLWKKKMFCKKKDNILKHVMAKNRYSAPNSDLWILSSPYSIARVKLNIPTYHFHGDLLNMNPSYFGLCGNYVHNLEFKVRETTIPTIEKLKEA